MKWLVTALIAAAFLILCAVGGREPPSTLPSSCFGKWVFLLKECHR